MPLIAIMACGFFILVITQKMYVLLIKNCLIIVLGKITNGKGKCVAYNKCRDGRHLYILSFVFVDGSFDSNPPIDEPANGSTFGESGAS